MSADLALQQNLAKPSRLPCLALACLGLLPIQALPPSKYRLFKTLPFFCPCTDAGETETWIRVKLHPECHTVFLPQREEDLEQLQQQEQQEQQQLQQRHQQQQQRKQQQLEKKDEKEKQQQQRKQQQLEKKDEKEKQQQQEDEEEKQGEEE